MRQKDGAPVSPCVRRQGLKSKMKQIDEKQWEQISDSTVTCMLEHIKPFSTPISRVISETEGEHLGSGSYFKVEGRRYIITNEHVARKLNYNSLTHKFYDDDNILKLTNPAYTASAPIDVAISRIAEESWNFCVHKSLAIPINRFAQKHNPIQHELLFFTGYSGERAKVLFGNLITAGTPYLPPECPFPTGVDGADPKFHFSLFYKPDLARSVDGNSHLPNPHGFSGSLVWDTKRIACLKAQKEWSPELAEVTGIVWGWPSSDACILATKVEHLHVEDISDIEENDAEPNA